MSNVREYDDLIAFHPGSYVEDIVDSLNITQAEFAQRLGLSSKTVSKIINGEDSVSAATANKLERVTGISMQTWLNLQAQYDSKEAEIAALQSTDEDEVAAQIDVGFLKRNGLIPDKLYRKEEKKQTYRQLFKIADLTQLRLFNPAVSYRKAATKSESKSIVCSNVMLELATNTARDATEVPFEKNALVRVLPQIRKMSTQAPEVFYPDLVNKLRDCGIVLVALPNLPGAGLNGATRKFRNGSVLVLITDRAKYGDVFWFSLVHELGHVYYNDFHSDPTNHEAYAAKEARADKFAAEFFIPNDLYQTFLATNVITNHSIREFADRLGINPGIVVGRLQSDKVINFSSFNSLKTKYQIMLNTAE